jgi:hypothetical protein
MTTKPPAKVQESPADSLEKKAYTSVSAIPTEEPNDRNRLGYHIWRWLKERHGTLEQAVVESGSRLHVSSAEAVKTITESLKKQGVLKE